MLIRNRSTGQVIDESQFKAENPGVMLPRIWTAETYNAIGYDPITPIAPPGLPSSSLKEWYRDGVIQNSNGDWVFNWIERDIYESADPETKARLEAQHIERETIGLAEAARSRRKALLLSSDWTQFNDAPLTDAQKTVWATYRQALRDVPSQAGFPRDITWPDVP